MTEVEEGLDAEEIGEVFDNENDNNDHVTYLNDADYFEDDVHEDDDVATFGIEGVDDITANTSVLEAGDYEFEFDVTDSLASDNATLEVRDDDAERNFVNDPYIQQQGDEFNITVELEDTDDTYVTVGDYDDNAYEVGLYVEDTEGDYDEVNITFNTHETNTEDVYDAFEAQQDDAELEVVYALIADDDIIAIGDDDHIQGDVGDLDADEVGSPDSLAEELSDPLVADDYELTTSAALEVDDGEIDFVDRGDTSFINLEPLGSPGDVTTYTAPEDDSMSDLEDFEDATVTATDSVAEDDYLLMELEDAGMTGALAEFGDNDDGVATGLASEGIYVEVEQTDAASNLGDVVWNNSADLEETDVDGEQLEMTLVNGDDYEGEQLLFDIPTDQFGEGEYEWTIEFSDENVYVDDDEDFEIEGEFDIDEREVSLDDVDEVPNVDGAELSGDTTVAPGTEIDMVASASGEFVLTDDPVVADDRTFTGSFDFSDYDAGIEFDVEADEPLGDGEDDFTAELVDGDGPVINVEADAPSSADVGEDVTLDVTVTNTGGAAADDVDIGVVIGGENVDDTNSSIDADESWTNSYEFTSDSEGDIEWSVTADDSEETGVTNFSDEETDDDASDDDATDDDASDDDASDDDASDDDGETDDDGDDDGTPGFGVAVALAALLGAAMLALRKQN
ncbi:BGTF surface domain-containing protein [Natrialba sp. SSL1]|uniref:BGTF surface domain-containing protein n=1 Tax=Natrialba sp. SSL1 TaxID=1869245 RepID=UPI000A4F3845|nr:BGTF surface domain-containing protein [Natrialba sp. SSL1]